MTRTGKIGLVVTLVVIASPCLFSVAIEGKLKMQQEKLAQAAQVFIATGDESKLLMLSDKLGMFTGHMENHYVQEHLMTGESGTAYVDKEAYGWPFKSRAIVIMIYRQNKPVRFIKSGQTHAF
jgi:hypothetical protein